ncbi:MAG: hypothetical protein GY717_02605 [Rhodobacteraceae bacterium]|nr:hypothetical protein [Paracoccaceae bacterium]
MAHTFKHLGKLALPLTALSLSVFGLAAGTSAHSSDDADQPMTCEISVSKGSYGHTYEGVIHATETIKGSYELNITKRGSTGSAMISQSGDFRVAGGDTETLGRATFGGLPPDSVDAQLTLRWNGHKMICSNQPTEI